MTTTKSPLVRLFCLHYFSSFFSHLLRPPCVSKSHFAVVPPFLFAAGGCYCPLLFGKRLDDWSKSETTILFWSPRFAMNGLLFVPIFPLFFLRLAPRHCWIVIHGLALDSFRCTLLFSISLPLTKVCSPSL